MHSSLRILQITLIITAAVTPTNTAGVSTVSSATAVITQSTSPYGSVSNSFKTSIVPSINTATMELSKKTSKASVTTGVLTTSSIAAAQINNALTKLFTSLSQTDSVTGSVTGSGDSSEPPKTSSAPGNTKGTAINVPDASKGPTTLTPWSLWTRQTPSMTVNLRSSSTSRQSSIASTTAEPIVTSLSQTDSVTGSVTGSGDSSEPPKTSSAPGNTKGTAINVPDASKGPTTLTPWSLWTRQTPSMTVNLRSSSTSRQSSIASTTAEPTATRSSSILQTPTTSPAVSVNWTEWSVDSSDCQKYCSEKGGTVTASRHCYSKTKSIFLENTVCTKHDNLTKVVKCEERYCELSGKEAFRSSVSTLTVSMLLVMLSSTFFRG